MPGTADRLWSLYFLICGKDGHYYAGVTTDVDRRVLQHRDGKGSKYTNSRRPYIYFRFSVTCTSKSEALKLEKRVKKLTRKQKEQFMDTIRRQHHGISQ